MAFEAQPLTSTPVVTFLGFLKPNANSSQKSQIALRQPHISKVQGWARCRKHKVTSEKMVCEGKRSHAIGVSSIDWHWSNRKLTVTNDLSGSLDLTKLTDGMRHLYLSSNHLSGFADLTGFPPTTRTPLQLQVRGGKSLSRSCLKP